MKAPVRKLRCAIYTRKSSEEGLEMEFNSLDAQREAAMSYIQRQKSEGWILVGDRYDDGGFSGGSMERTGLQALDGYYHRLAGRDEAAVPVFGYSDQPISYAVVLRSDGTALDIVPLGSQGRRRFEPERVPVPGPIIRTSGIAANFLWDKTSYVLGVKRDPQDKTKIVETPRERAAFRKLHEELLTRTDDEGLRAVLAFLASWTPALFKQLSNGPDVLDANLVFRLDGELGFIHDQPAARDIWARRLAGNKGADGLCLVSGKTAPLARLHPSIKGVRDAQSSGAAIVSFNLDAFTSFGKDQGLNAPVSEQAAFAYTTALNHLLRPSEHNRQRLQIADATTVFWAEARTPEEEPAAEAAEELFPWMAAPPSQGKLDMELLWESGGFCEVTDEVFSVRGRDLIEAGLNEPADGRAAMGIVAGWGGPRRLSGGSAWRSTGSGRGRRCRAVGSGSELNRVFVGRRAGPGAVGTVVGQDDGCRHTAASVLERRGSKGGGAS